MESASLLTLSPYNGNLFRIAHGEEFDMRFAELGNEEEWVIDPDKPHVLRQFDGVRHLHRFLNAAFAKVELSYQERHALCTPITASGAGFGLLTVLIDITPVVSAWRMLPV